jgi:hypothetical protein
VDQGPSQELVQVLAAPPVTGTTFSANFVLPHPGPTSPVPYYLIRPLEGVDADFLPSARATGHILHMSVKQRGNRQENFFTAHLPAASPFFPFLAAGVPNPSYAPTTFFDQAIDGRYQDLVPTSDPAPYKTQWAEVAYFLVPNGATAEGTTLYALYRCELKVVPDNRYINGQAYTPTSPGIPFSSWAAYNELSCQQKFNSTVGAPYYYFNNTSDLATLAQGSLPAAITGPGLQTTAVNANSGVNLNIQAGSVLIVDSGPQAEMVVVAGPPSAPPTTAGTTTTFSANFNLTHAAGAPVFVVNRGFMAAQAGLRGAFNTSSPDAWSATLLATDVVSFDVKILPNLPGFSSDFSDVVPVPGWPFGTYDTALPVSSAAYSIRAVQITLRVCDLKTRQTRQVSIIQDM